jgi:tripartite-type tricarboxylate transporter receptor subunit TctC
MRLSRRQFLHLLAGAGALSSLSRVAQAQTYPARPVHFIVGFAAGQSIDILARLMGEWLSARLGQPFIVENRPGAGGNIAAEAVVRAPSDGYTLLLIGANNAINATLYEHLNFNLVPQVMVVSPTFPAKTIPEFIAYTKANPGKINFASAGVGSVAHVTGELFKMMTEVNMQHVPYRGGPPALADLMAGQVQVMFDNMPSSIGHIRAGQLRALGVSTPKRLDLLPDVPTISEFVAGFETVAFAGLGAPKGTPPDIVEKLNREVNLGLADPKLSARIIDLGGVPLQVSSAEFGRFVAQETEKWGKAVKFSGAKPN